MQIQKETIDLNTATGKMRCYIYRPCDEGVYPSIIFYSEIFQQTAPISRSAAIMACHGFVVIVPEVFHELNPAGTVLEYDDIGKDKGNEDKSKKPLIDHDSDTLAMLDFIHSATYCSNAVGAMGVCIGGHLAYRAALNPAIKAAFCLYATDIHNNALSAEPEQQSLARMADIKGEIHFIWGKQDPHVPNQGRLTIYQQCIATGINYQWCEVNGVHAFMRDEGDRYDGALALQMYQQAVALFQRVLH
ncbi:dienelactone hydrolase family protein [Aliiglaciecola sp. 2_MG-2023]|uniref:dienelactone hydrolase family protein n=1 Tax=unclassified Aliiglaciecola TaxID=2593648 RepID=UPI0026E386E8|nr:MULTISPECIES: dienelactone hydrolase family protein [unclassified Aliiglaciecola]MDO6710095.1 dienelactone hydrolase family protein [Aliiglaciecola sp. 2_MG-2023]MDO6751243.1 dienelactone hydrolase family protein [Aliiglaciecola sp. 1_MG-2023]